MREKRKARKAMCKKAGRGYSNAAKHCGSFEEMRWKAKKKREGGEREGGGVFR